MSEATAITTRSDIEIVRLMALRAALKLEIVGLKRKGPSAYAIIKREFKLTGTKQKVMDAFTERLDKIIEQCNKERANENVLEP